jgi:hypothetical protein
MVKDSTAHCHAVFFPPIVLASGYFGFMWGKPKEPEGTKIGGKKSPLE